MQETETALLLDIVNRFCVETGVINCYIKIENTYTGLTAMIDAELTARYKVEQQTSYHSFPTNASKKKTWNPDPLNRVSLTTSVFTEY